MNLVFLGPPGAGKGTQAQRLARHHGWPHLSSGDILRAERSADSPLGRKAAEYMDAGKLVPDELVVALMVDRVGRDDCGGGFILDGFPRTAPQAEALDKALADGGRPLDGVVYFDCPDGEVLGRITGRRSCPKCAAIYHVVTLPPKKEGVCDRCEAELVQRKDDTAEVVAERLAAYRRQTEPLIAYYRGQGLLRELNAAGAIGEIEETLEKMLTKAV